MFVHLLNRIQQNSGLDQRLAELTQNFEGEFFFFDWRILKVNEQNLFLEIQSLPQIPNIFVKN